jgi:glutathione S-transferase
VLVDGDQAVGDSWRIALHLEQNYPDAPSLFGDQGVQLTRFLNSWADTTLLPAIARIIVVDIHGCIDPIDKDYFRTSREKAFGASLEAVVADRTAHLAVLKRALNPLRHVLRDQEFISGAAPTYADYCVFGMFMWARCCSPIALLAEDDPIYRWRESMLDLFDGYARSAPCAGRAG